MKKEKKISIEEEKSLEKYKEKRRLVDIFNKKWLLKGTTTLVLVAVIIAIYVGVNFILSIVILPEIDMTKNKLYSLSEESKIKAKNIKKDITITLINYDSNSEMYSTAEKYKAENSKIKIENIEGLSSRPDIMKEYYLETDSKVVIISTESKEKVLTEYDLNQYDYSTNQTIDKTEEAITNAIVEVTIEKKPIIYFMTNHILYSKEYFSTVLAEVENDSNEVKTVDLLIEGKVPDDCDCLIITTLKEDLTEAETEYIVNYIEKGGEILVLAGPNLLGKELKNFDAILAEYGLKIEEGVVFEGSNSNTLAGYQDIIIEEVPSNSITQKLNMSISTCMVDAAAITINNDKLKELNVDTEVLITTSSNAFIRKDIKAVSTTKLESDSENGEYILGVLATKKIDENTISKVVVYSNEYFASDMTIPINQMMYPISYLYNNVDIAVNTISYLNEREEVITIRKLSDKVTYTATELQHNIVMVIIFATPALIIVLGIIIWIKRRRQK